LLFITLAAVEVGDIMNHKTVEGLASFVYFCNARTLLYAEKIGQDFPSL